VAVALLERKSSLFAHQREASDGHPNSLNKEKRSMKALVARFVREEAGQDLIEYGLLIGIITAAAITAIQAIGPKVGGYFSNLNALLP
jgi:pilus assembly protein Flp/PilA